MIYEDIEDKTNKNSSEQLLMDFVSVKGENILNRDSKINDDFNHQYVLEKTESTLNAEIKYNTFENIDDLKRVIASKLYEEMVEDSLINRQCPKNSLVSKLMTEQEDKLDDFLIKTQLLYGTAQDFLDEFADFVQTKYDDKKSYQALTDFIQDCNGLILSDNIYSKIDDLITNSFKTDVKVEISHITFDDYKPENANLSENLNHVLQIAKLPLSDFDATEDRIAMVMQYFGGEYDTKTQELSINSKKISSSSIFNYLLQNNVTLDDIANDVNDQLSRMPIMHALDSNYYDDVTDYRICYFVTMSAQDAINVMLKSNRMPFTDDFHKEYINFKTNESMVMPMTREHQADKYVAKNTTEYTLPIDEIIVSPYLTNTAIYPTNKCGVHQYYDVSGKTLQFETPNKNELNLVFLKHVPTISQKFAVSMNLDNLNNNFQSCLDLNYGSLEKWVQGQKDKYGYIPHQTNESLKRDIKRVFLT